MEPTLPILRERASVAASRALEKRTSSQQPEKVKLMLLDTLSRIEDAIIRLHDLIFSKAQKCSFLSIQALITSIREDERDLMEMCVHRCDRENPDISLNHDRVNNDVTLSLYEQLSIATQFGVRYRLILLHQLQRQICKRLQILGIDVSQG